jgi:hypothetical protein
MAVIKIVNAEGGSDARYDTSRMTPEERARFDSDGRPLGADEPDQWTWTNGLPGARGGTGPGFYGGGGGGGGGDLYQMALGSPFYQQAQSATQAAEAADAAQRKQAIQQLLIQFGIIPANFTDQYGDVDQVTRDLASQNTSSGVSVAARLLQGLNDQNRTDLAQLGANGLRRSGARGFKLRRNQLQYDQQKSDALTGLLGQINSLYGNYAQNAYGRQMSLLSALQSAINSMSQFYVGGSGGGAGGRSAPPVTPPQPSQTYTAPGFVHAGVGVPNSSGYAIQTGGGYYTNPQTDQLTAKWQKLGGMG